MSWINIVSLVIEILSFFATIAVSITIFVIESNRQSREKINSIKNRAREFIQDYDNEKGYLPLAQFANFLHPLHKHYRKIYNEFSKCEPELQKEILRLSNFTYLNLNKYNSSKFVDELLEKFSEEAKNLELYSSLFDFKYFYRGFDLWAGMKINGNYEIDKSNNENELNYFDKKFYREYYANCYSRLGENDIWLRLLDYSSLNHLSSDIEKERYYKNAKLASSLLKETTPIYGYIIPNNFTDFLKMHDIKPLDYYWSLVTECPESECTYIVMEMVHNATLLINRVKNKDWLVPFEGEYIVERNEDLFYVTIQTLYSAFIKDIENVSKNKKSL